MNRNNESPRGGQGFTLIEVMVAMVIFLIIALGLAKGEIAALLAQESSMYRNAALKLAEDELSSLKGAQFTQSSTSADLDASASWSTPQNITVNMRNGAVTFSKSVLITDMTTTAIEMKRIDVAVGWNQKNETAGDVPTNKNHQIFLSTILVQSD